MFEFASQKIHVSKYPLFVINNTQNKPFLQTKHMFDKNYNNQYNTCMNKYFQTIKHIIALDCASKRVDFACLEMFKPKVI